MNENEQLRNADFLQMAAHSLETGDLQCATETLQDVAMALNFTEFDREANTLLGAALHTRLGRTDRAQRFVGEVFDRLTQGQSLKQTA